MRRFDRLSATLIRRWKRYQDAPRDPEHLPELAQARRALDEIRTEIADARSDIGGSSGPLPIGRASTRLAVSHDDLMRLRVQGTFPEG